MLMWRTNVHNRYLYRRYTFGERQLGDTLQFWLWLRKGTGNRWAERYFKHKTVRFFLRSTLGSGYSGAMSVARSNPGSVLRTICNRGIELGLAECKVIALSFTFFQTYE